MTDHKHIWIPAPELGWARYYCRCGEVGWRNNAGRIVVEPAWHPKRDFDPTGVVHLTGGRKPSLDHYDRSHR